MVRPRTWAGAVAALAVALVGAPVVHPATASTVVLPAPRVVAGGGEPDYGEGVPATAAVVRPQALARDGLGNVYVLDGARSFFSPNVRRIATDGSIAAVPSAEGAIAVAADGAGALYVGRGAQVLRLTPTGTTVVAGTGATGDNGDGGPATSASFRLSGLAVAPDGTIFVADASAHRVRRVAVDGTITTYAGTGVAGLSGDGGPATAAQLDQPRMLALDGTGNLYVFQDSAWVRRITPGGVISTVAGNGVLAVSTVDGVAATTVSMSPVSLAADADGVLLVEQNGVRRVGGDGVIRRVSATVATSLVVEPSGDRLLALTDRIVREPAGGGAATVVAGGGHVGLRDGPALDAYVGAGSDALAAGPDGSVYLLTYVPGGQQTVVRRVRAGVVSSVAGDRTTAGNTGDGGPALSAGLAAVDVTVAPDGVLYLLTSDRGSIRRVGADGIITTVAGPGLDLRRLEAGPDGRLYALTGAGSIVEVRVDGSLRTVLGGGAGPATDGAPAAGSAATATVFAPGPDGSIVYADPSEPSRYLRRVGPDGLLRTVADRRTLQPGDPLADLGEVRFLRIDGAGTVYAGWSYYYLEVGVITSVRRIDRAGTATTVARSFDTQGLVVIGDTVLVRGNATGCCRFPFGALLAFDGAASAPGAAWVPVAPARVFDTRDGSGGVPIGRVATGGVLEVLLAGRFGVAVGSSAVVLNVTVTEPVAAGFVTVFPCGERPLASSVNFVAGQTVANAVVVPLLAVGSVCFYASQAAHLVVDLSGGFVDGFVPVVPTRLVDTREVGDVVVGGSVLEVPVTRRPELAVPVDARAVAVNVTVTEPVAAGFVTVFPCGERPLASSVNFVAGQTVANGSLAALSSTGSLCVFASQTTHVIVDVFGALGRGFGALEPARSFDTRDGSGGVAAGPVAAGGVLEVPVAGRAAVPGGGVAAAVALNVTVTEPAAAGFVTVFPCGERPLASNVNFVAGQTVANLVVVPVSAAGTVCVFASQPTHLLADVTGWFLAGAA